LHNANQIKRSAAAGAAAILEIHENNENAVIFVSFGTDSANLEASSQAIPARSAQIHDPNFSPEQRFFLARTVNLFAGNSEFIRRNNQLPLQPRLCSDLATARFPHRSAFARLRKRHS
jgi:hypothetical protein